MIAALKGILEEKSPSVILMDVQGVGYEVFISLNTYDRLPGTGSPCRLYIHHVVRDDAQLLFGFVQKEEKQMFTRLINVSGIGPKTALSILSGLTISELSNAVAENNVKRISAVHGIGKKTAERLIIELRDKISPFETFASPSAGGSDQQGSVIRDTLLALESLGFPQEQARKMVDAACKKNDGKIPDTEELLRLSLNSK